MLFCVFVAWTNNLSDYEDEGYSDVDEEESDEEFNQKTEGNTHTYRCCLLVVYRIFSPCSFHCRSSAKRWSRRFWKRCYPSSAGKGSRKLGGQYSVKFGHCSRKVILLNKCTRISSSRGIHWNFIPLLKNIADCLREYRDSSFSISTRVHVTNVSLTIGQSKSTPFPPFTGIINSKIDDKLTKAKTYIILLFNIWFVICS